MSNTSSTEHSSLKMLRLATAALASAFKRGRGESTSHKSELLNGVILDSLACPVAVIDQQGKIVSVNKPWTSFGRRNGVPAESLIGPGANYLEVCRRAAAAGCPQAADALSGIQGVCDGIIPSYEFQYPCPSPEGDLWFQMTVTPLLAQEKGAVVTHNNISDLKRTETSLRESEEKFRAMADKAPAMIWMADADKRCVYLNKQWMDFTGKPLSEILGRGWLEGIHPEDKAGYLAAYNEAFEKRQNFRSEYRQQGVDGGYRWVLNIGVPSYNGNGEFAGMIGTCIDITDRRMAEETLTDLGGRLINAQEEERNRIARELHDDLSQKMALLSIEIEQLAQVASKSLPSVGADLREVLSGMREASSEVHRMSYELHPSKLDRLGLAATSLSLCREISKQHSVHVECDFKDLPDVLPRDVSLCLYRVLQESLQNVIKHSGACNATVELFGSSSEIHLTIADEGVGFKPDSAVKKGGLGLLSMRERLRLVGGTISVESQPLRGTRVHAVVPMPSSDPKSGRGPEGLRSPARYPQPFPKRQSFNSGK